MTGNASGQAERRAIICQCDRDLVRRENLFADDGLWLEDESDYRVLLWHCLALYEGDPADVALANRIIERNTELPLAHAGHFSVMSAIQVLKKHGDKITPAVRQILSEHIRPHLIIESATEFSGYNDNFPSMATFSALVGGELFDVPEAVDNARLNLEQARDLLQRCGTLSEYNSPVYTPISLLCCAEMVNYARDERCRELAAGVEERLWYDVATHFHAPSSRLAGPYSRAYRAPSSGSVTMNVDLMYHVYGDRVYINPPKDLYTLPDALLHHTRPSMSAGVVWIASADYHPGEEIERLIFERPYPYRTSMLVEWGEFPMINHEKNLFLSDTKYPCGHGLITTYMEEDYALSAAERQFLSSASSNAFSVTYRRKTDASDLADTRTVFCRYIVGDKRLDSENYYPARDQQTSREQFWDQGRCFCLQKDNTVLAVYNAQPDEREGIASLKLSVILPIHFGDVDEIRIGGRTRVGGRTLTGNTGAAEEPEPVFVRDGPVYMAFIPLRVSDHGAEAAVRVEEQNGYKLISFYNYQGPARDFDREELWTTGNGFVCKMGSNTALGRAESFDAFCQRVSDYELVDAMRSISGGEVRELAYRDADVTFRLCYSPVTEAIKHATVDGRFLSREVFQATGVDPRTLPFLGGDDHKAADGVHPGLDWLAAIVARR